MKLKNLTGVIDDFTEMVGETVLFVEYDEMRDTVYMDLSNDKKVILSVNDNCVDPFVFGEYDRYNFEKMLAVGWITQEEISAYEKDVNEQCRARQEETERAQYDRLKKKFEK